MVGLRLGLGEVGGVRMGSFIDIACPGTSESLKVSSRELLMLDVSVPRHKISCCSYISVSRHAHEYASQQSTDAPAVHILVHYGIAGIALQQDSV